MLKHIAGFLLVSLLGLGLSGCGEKKKSDAQTKVEKEKAWRERQRVQAIKYYNELIKNHPESPHLEEAKKDLETLGPAPAPAKK